MRQPALNRRPRPACRFNTTQQCSKDENFTGLYEVPVWQLTQLGGPYTLNPGA